jgi:hypothetical protein
LRLADPNVASTEKPRRANRDWHFSFTIEDDVYHLGEIMKRPKQIPACTYPEAAVSY